MRISLWHDCYFPLWHRIVMAGSSRSFATSCLTLHWAVWWPSAPSRTCPESRTTWTSWSVCPLPPVCHKPLTLEAHLKTCNLKSVSLLAGLPLQRQPALSGLQLSPSVCAHLFCHSHRPQGGYMSLTWCFCTYF